MEMKGTRNRGKVNDVDRHNKDDRIVLRRMRRRTEQENVHHDHRSLNVHEKQLVIAYAEERGIQRRVCNMQVPAWTLQWLFHH